MAIKCCYGCVAPKRYPGCHDRCGEYLEEKSAHNRLKAEADKKRAIDGAIYSQRSIHVYKAMKDRHKKG